LGIFQPPGGGGESIAIKLHQESAPGEPFIQIDGPLMDPELLDSALMPLLNRLSDSEKSLGTVLLKEISHTSVDSQRRLDSLLASFPDRLRLIAIADLRDQEIAYPTNSEDLIPRDEQTSGIIVPELMDRLDSVQVICQPLSRRVNDIHLIAGALLDRQQASGQSTAERISRPALDAMVNYPWPRNFSELEDAIIHACRTAVSESIRLEDLPLSIRSYRSPAPKNTIKPLPLDDALALHEQQLLTEAMEQAGGNRSEAARQLGISRSRLIRKLDQDSNREGRSST
jgi:DNA-binding NtrC family response regulator